ncbi:hypothetical protein Tco_0158097, partial [Tanacetum coccineum]
SSIPGIVDTYLANKMNEAIKTAVQLQSDKLRDKAFTENEAFINSLDDNMQKIIKEQVKQQVKKQVSKILPRIEKTLSSLAQKVDPRESFNELMDTPLDFSAFVMNWLKVDTLTLELLTSPTFKLMKGSCKSLIELEYLIEEVYKVTIDQLD